MNKLISFLIIFIVSFQAGAEELSPQKLQAYWAFTTVRTFLNACLLSDECPFADGDLQIAQQIVQNDKFYSAKTLQFKSAKADPDFFESSNGEAHRIMMTGLSPEAAIYINTDRLEDAQEPLAIDTLFALFAHELVHHLGIKDDSVRTPDRFAAAVIEMMRARLITVASASAQEVIIFNFPQLAKSQSPSVFPQGLHPALAIKTAQQFSSSRLEQVQSQNFEICQFKRLWSSNAVFNREKSIQLNDGTVQKSLLFNMTGRCFDKDKGKFIDSSFFMTTNLQLDEGSKEILRASIKFNKPVSLNETDAIQTLLVRKVTAPTIIHAGHVLTIQAEIYSRTPLQSASCFVNFSAENWVGPNDATPLLVNNDSCKVLSSAGNMFTLEATVTVPAKAPNGLKLYPALFALGEDANHNRVGTAAIKTSIDVTSATQNLPKLQAVQVIKQNKRSLLLFTVDSFAQIIDGYFQFEATTQTQDQVGLLLMAASANLISARKGFYLPLQIPEAPKELQGLKALRFAVIDENWNYLSGDLTSVFLQAGDLK